MAKSIDDRPIRTYRITWVGGVVETINAQSVFHGPANGGPSSGHIQFWLNSVLVLSVLGSDVTSVRVAPSISTVVGGTSEKFEINVDRHWVDRAKELLKYYGTSSIETAKVLSGEMCIPQHGVDGLIFKIISAAGTELFKEGYKHRK